METVGVYLKKEREAKAISLGDVARSTKISRFYLDYIERDEFEKLPQGPYIKAYLSSYSEQIGSDVNEVLKLYEALNKGKDEPLRADDWNDPVNGVAADPQQAEMPTKRRSIGWPKHALPSRRIGLFGAFGLLATGILLLAGFGFHHLFLGETRPPVMALKSPSETPAPKAAPSPVDRSQSPAAQRKPVAADRPQPAVDHTQPNDSDPIGRSEPVPPLSQRLQTATADPSPVHSVPEKTRTEAAGAPIPVVDIEPPEAKVKTPAAQPLAVLGASVCAGVENRMPVGVATVFPASAKRVYVWSQLQAEQVPTNIHHVYYLDGNRISDVALKVKSTFWRTWSYKTMPAGRQQGQWRVDITTSDGTVLQQLDFTVR